jgi:threonine synthase
VPIPRLVVGSNTNDILTRFFETRAMTAEAVVPTLSPSMDIQVSSNFERLLFEMNDRDGGLTEEQLHRFRSVGRLDVEDDVYDQWLAPVFRAARFDDDATIATIAQVYADTGLLVEPHTAVGIAAARARREPGTPIVTLATAHPAKFPDAVVRATGVHPPLPAHLADLFDREERTNSAPADLAAVQSFVRSHSRVG